MTTFAHSNGDSHGNHSPLSPSSTEAQKTPVHLPPAVSRRLRHYKHNNENMRL